MRLEKLYGTPVLLSGMGALVLLSSEIEMINCHINQTFQNLMRLHENTPHCVTAFLAGTLPGTALVHLRYLSNFGMVARNPGSILFNLGLEIFSTSKGSSRSWFSKIRNICLLYQLPHPLQLMRAPLKKETYKALVKKKVVSYWEMKYRNEADVLPSLMFFNPRYMSLTSPHPLWVSAGSSPYEVSKATIQARMLSGRYRTELLCSHWSGNPHGWCTTPDCQGLEVSEDIQHILLSCPSLEPTCENLLIFTKSYCLTYPVLNPILSIYCSPSHPQFCQFLLDCSCMPVIITFTQEHGIDALHHLLYICRTWCYCLHRDRARLLGRWTRP